MLSPYRRIFAVPGAKLFSAYGLVGRLPISMVSLGIVLGVTLRHGTYTLAGSVSAAFVPGGHTCPHDPARRGLACRSGGDRVQHTVLATSGSSPPTQAAARCRATAPGPTAEDGSLTALGSVTVPHAIGGEGIVAD